MAASSTAGAIRSSRPRSSSRTRSRAGSQVWLGSLRVSARVTATWRETFSRAGAALRSSERSKWPPSAPASSARLPAVRTTAGRTSPVSRSTALAVPRTVSTVPPRPGRYAAMDQAGPVVRRCARSACAAADRAAASAALTAARGVLRRRDRRGGRRHRVPQRFQGAAGREQLATGVQAGDDQPARTGEESGCRCPHQRPGAAVIPSHQAGDVGHNRAALEFAGRPRHPLASQPRSVWLRRRLTITSDPLPRSTRAPAALSSATVASEEPVFASCEGS